MKKGEMILKLEDIFCTLRDFREKSKKASNDIVLAKILKDFLQFIFKEKYQIEKVALSAKICLKNEARLCAFRRDNLEELIIRDRGISLASITELKNLISRNLKDINFFLKHLDDVSKALDKPSQTFRDYSDAIDRYMYVEESFKIVKDRVELLLKTLEQSKFCDGSFRKLITSSAPFSDMDKEVEVDLKYTRCIKGQD